MLKTNTDKSTDKVKEIQDIEHNADELLNMVNQILDLRKLESDQLKLEHRQADLVLYIKYLVDIHQYYADQKQIQLSFHSGVDELWMDFDPDKIKAIISNLVSNAIKFSKTGGLVNVCLDKNTPHNRVEIKVKDTGVGLSDVEKNKVFELFYQSKGNLFTNEKGSGIGLYYTKKLVEAMQGIITLHSDNDGSTFEIKLPITNKAEMYRIDNDVTINQNRSISQNELSSHKLNSEKLLIVDNNASIRDLLKQQLSSYHLVFANDGLSGLEKAKGELPDLIISDIMMPVMDGYELCRTIKSDINTSHIPVMLLTAKTDQDSKLKGLQAEADVYLKKPFDYDELILQIKNLVENRKKLRNIYRNFNDSFEQTSLPTEDAFIQKFRESVLMNAKNSDLNINMVCKNLGISRTGLHTKIKALTGLSTTNYINLIKIQEAKNIIENSNKNISEISYELGFGSISYFSRLFKKEYGISPSERRKAKN